MGHPNKHTDYLITQRKNTLDKLQTKSCSDVILKNENIF